VFFCKKKKNRERDKKKVDQGMVEHTPQKELTEKEKRKGEEGKVRTRSNDMLPRKSLG
jgi:hypothetical protein